MTSRNERLTKLLLTQRAISELVEIEAYSVQQWGKHTAGKYLGAIESGLQLIRENPRILRSIEGLPAELKNYRVNMCSGRSIPFASEDWMRCARCWGVSSSFATSLPP